MKNEKLKRNCLNCPYFGQKKCTPNFSYYILDHKLYVRNK